MSAAHFIYSQMLNVIEGTSADCVRRSLFGSQDCALLSRNHFSLKKICEAEHLMLTLIVFFPALYHFTPPQSLSA